MDILDQILAVGPVAAGVFAFVLLVALDCVRRSLQDPLKHIPGPFLARFSRLWLLRQYLKGDFHNVNVELHQKHGPVVRISPNHFSIDDVDAARIIYGHGSRFCKGDWYLPWGHPQQRNLFNEVDPSTHARMRREVANLYSMSSMVSYEPHVDACTSIFCQRLAEFARAGGAPVDMRHWFQCYAFDVIGIITFSKRLGFLDAGQDVGGLMAALGSQHALASAVGLFSSWYPLVFKLISWRSSKTTRPTGPAYIARFAQSELESRRQYGDSKDGGGGGGPDDFIAKILRKRDGEVSNETLHVTAGANVAAGSDTTAITLSAVLYHLCRSPAALRTLRAELDGAALLQHADDNDSTTLSFKDAQSLPYLQAVIKEALRMHPATGFTMPRVVPAGGCTLAGRFFPEGTTVGVNAWVAHRNRTVFGDDAHVFRPERWLDGERNSGLMDAYFFSFGQGSRTCIGKNISLLEVSKCIPRLLRRFDFELARPGGMVCVNHWFVKPNELLCYIRERRH